MKIRALLLNCFLTVAGKLPLRANHRLGTWLGLALYRFSKPNRRITELNVELCWPELSLEQQRNLVRKSLIEDGKGATETAFFWRQPTDKVLSKIRHIHGLELFDRAIEQDQGVLLAAPHLGAWELLCQYLSTRMSCAMLYRQPRQPEFEQIIIKARTRLGADLIRADARGVRQLFRAAKQGKLIGILPDQQPKKGTGEFAPFFGHPALTMVLYSKLAARTSASMLVAWAERLDRSAGYDLHFAAVDEAVRSDNLAQSTAALNATIEHQVRRCPEQYQWGYKRFDWQPDGSRQYQLSATPKNRSEQN